MTQRMRNDAGFTLISVLIALVLLSLGVMALSRASSDVLRAQSDASLRTAGLAIARAHLEELRTRPPAELVSETAVQVNEGGEVDPNGQYTRTVEVEDMSRNLVKVTVRVDYPRARVPVELVTLAFIGLN